MKARVEVIENKLHELQSEVKAVKYFIWYVAAMITTKAGIDVAPQVINVVLAIFK